MGLPSHLTVSARGGIGCYKWDGLGLAAGQVDRLIARSVACGRHECALQGSLGSLVAGEPATASLAASDKFGNVFSLGDFLQVWCASRAIELLSAWHPASCNDGMPLALRMQLEPWQHA